MDEDLFKEMINSNKKLIRTLPRVRNKKSVIWGFRFEENRLCVVNDIS